MRTVWRTDSKRRSLARISPDCDLGAARIDGCHHLDRARDRTVRSGCVNEPRVGVILNSVRAPPFVMPTAVFGREAVADQAHIPGHNCDHLWEGARAWQVDMAHIQATTPVWTSM